MEGKTRGWVDSDGYRRTRVGGRKVYIHRYKHESRFGLLLPGFELHHKDENKARNAFSNMAVVWKPDHARLHNKLRAERKANGIHRKGDKETGPDGQAKNLPPRQDIHLPHLRQPRVQPQFAGNDHPKDLCGKKAPAGDGAVQMRGASMSQKSPILLEVGRKALQRFSELCFDGVGSQRADFLALCNSMLRAGRGANPTNLPLEYVLQQNAWYSSLEGGSPDFSVYSSDVAMADLWLCWVRYSRKYLQSISRPGALPGGKSVVDDIGSPASILDLGCGFGYTTASLKELFPAADCFGTNLPGTRQFTVASSISLKRNFNVLGDFKHAPAVDFVFASEYFEHFPNPARHLGDIIAHCNPKFLVVANSFSAKAIGHFGVAGGFEPHIAARQFNGALRVAGFENVKTNFWNGRPAYWRKTNE